MEVSNILYKKYLYIVIYIIVFLVFLNVFSLTYFYFTSLIQSNINKSNCGINLLEAETFRHIFLQDNTKDNTQDIYFIIIIIFSLYILYLLLGNYDSIDLHEDDDSKLSLILFCIMMMINLIGGFTFAFTSETKDLSSNLNYKSLSISILLVYIFAIIIYIGVVYYRNKNSILSILYILIKTDYYHLLFLNFLLIFIFLTILITNLDLYDFNTFGGNNSRPNNFARLYSAVIFGMFIIAPIILLFFNNSNSYFKSLVYFFIFLFIINLFFVYFNNKDKVDIGLEYFQLYDFNTEDKLGNDSRNNLQKHFNLINSIFVVFMLVIFIGIKIRYNEKLDDFKLSNIIEYIILFIIASYVVGIFYLIYKDIFPVQKASMEYKSILYNINQQVSLLCGKGEQREHSIDGGVLTFKVYDSYEDMNKDLGLDNFDTKEDKLTFIKDKFKELYPNYDSQDSYNQLQYEQYIIKVIEFIKDITKDPEINNDNFNLNNFKHFIYNYLITTRPKNISILKSSNFVKENYKEYGFAKSPENVNNVNIIFNDDTALHIPYNDIILEKVKKNFQYVTGKPGVIIQYNTLTDSEQNGLFWKVVDDDTDAKELNIKFETDQIFLETSYKTKNDKSIYKINTNIFENQIRHIFNSRGTKSDQPIYKIKIGDDTYVNIHKNKNNEFNVQDFTIDDYRFYCIQERTISDIEQLQNKSKNSLLAMPASTYICSYLDYGANENQVMNKERFVKYIEYQNKDDKKILNIKDNYDLIYPTIHNKIPENKFYILLIISIILAITILVFLFSIMKKYVTGDVYTPQIYVLGILAAFLVVFIFGEVIFSRIK